MLIPLRNAQLTLVNLKYTGKVVSDNRPVIVLETLEKALKTHLLIKSYC